MKREFRFFLEALMVMGVVTILLLISVSSLTYYLGWRADKAMQGITYTYILTGLSGGIWFGCRSKKRGLAKALLYGIILVSLYWGILGGGIMFFMGETIQDIGRFAIVWGLMTLSFCVGELICPKRK